MNKIKCILATAVMSLAMFPILSISQASAATTNSLRCNYNDGEVYQTGTEACDLGIDKQVSVNGGAFVEAPTQSSAVTAHVGDSVTWKVTVTNQSPTNYTPYGTVTVTDIVPSNITIGTATPSAGTFTSNNWTFSLAKNLPATLTITSTASTIGYVENTATLSGYASSCDGNCEFSTYCDVNPNNNTVSAFVNVLADPVVPVVPVVPTTPAVTTPVKVVTPNAPSTGFGVNSSSLIGSSIAYIIGASALLGLAYKARQAVRK